MNIELQNLNDEINEILKKYEIDEVILVNLDDNEMGYRQMVKMIDGENGKFLVLGYSGKGEVHCQSCRKSDMSYESWDNLVQ